LDSKPAYRLTSTSYAVLSLLELLGEATSYDLKQALVRSIENFWPVPHTTFYEEPARLADAGYLSARQEPAGRRRRLYELTASGREALDPAAAPEQIRDEALLKIFAGADPQAVLSGRAEYHRTKLAEFERYLLELRSGQKGPREDQWRGAEATLVVGIRYHRFMLALIDDFLAGGDGADLALAAGGEERDQAAASAGGES
jgi:PadR family transcriptional regulator, regulatory protein AphA